jgi:hypothetical protein
MKARVEGEERLRDRLLFDGVHVELCRPVDALIKPSDELKAGDRLYFSSAYRTVTEVQAWSPPLPEAAHDLASQITHHTRLGEFYEVNRLAREMASTAYDLAHNRDDEIRVKFSSSRWPQAARLRKGIPVAVQARQRATKADGPKLGEICQRLQAHMDRISADPQLNQFTCRPRTQAGGIAPFRNASARRAGALCRIVLPGFGSPFNIDRAHALAYLEWLDAGNVGHPRDARGAATLEP